MSTPCYRTRHSLQELQHLWENGKPQPLNDLFKAWKALKAAEGNNFMKIGGYHGLPFVPPTKEKEKVQYWGGWCQHGDVLFPTWHRFYVLEIEKALQEHVPGVMMPYWDQTAGYEELGVNLTYEDLDKLPDIPWALTNETVLIDGVECDNPLRSFVFPQAVEDPPYDVSIQGFNYTKKKGYETVRFPMNGLQIDLLPEDIRSKVEYETKAWIESGHAGRTKMLNYNWKRWLISGGPPSEKDVEAHQVAGIYEQYKNCLECTDYTSFSNTSDNPKTSLENPHNHVHLAVGGFDSDILPGTDGRDFNWPHDGPPSTVYANGDMGENETAALDPIFFFHHCNVDRMFWVWQKKQHKTHCFSITKGTPGTTPFAKGSGQGSTPKLPIDVEYSMETPLYPFKYQGRDATSNDCINIEEQLGYTYSIGSLDDESDQKRESKLKAIPRVEIAGEIMIRQLPAPSGSFVVFAVEEYEGKKNVIGRAAAFGRRSRQYCANCQRHPTKDIPISISRHAAERVNARNSTVSLYIRFAGRPPMLFGDFLKTLKGYNELPQIEFHDPSLAFPLSKI